MTRHKNTTAMLALAFLGLAVFGFLIKSFGGSTEKHVEQKQSQGLEELAARRFNR